MPLQTYRIRNTQLPHSKFDGGFDEMNRILDAADPAAVQGAAKAYADASYKFADSIAILRKAAATLAEHWGGDAAQKCLDQMENLYNSATGVASTSGYVSGSLADYAEQLGSFKRYRPSIGDYISRGGNINADLAAAKTAPQEHIEKLAEHVSAANNEIPEFMLTYYPQHGTLSGPQPIQDGTAGLPSGGFSADGGGSVPNDSFSPNNHLSATGNHASLDGARSHPMVPGGAGGTGLAGFGGDSAPGSAGGTDLAGLGPGGGPGTDVGSGRGGGAGLGPGGNGGGTAFGGNPGAGGLRPSMGVGGGRGMNARGIGANTGGKAAARQGMQAPAGGNGGGEGEEERERSTWLAEDPDVWAANDDTAPPLIG